MINFPVVDADIVDYDYINSLLDEGEYDTVITYLEQLSEENPNDIETLFNKAVTLEKLEDFDEALLYYDKVLEVDFGDLDALSNKGLLLYQLERFDEASNTFQYLLDLDPENEEAKLYINKINQRESESGSSQDYGYWPFLLGVVGFVEYFVLARRKRQKIVSKASISNQKIKASNILVKKINWKGLNKDFLALFYSDKLLFVRFGESKLNLEEKTVYEILKSDKENFCIFYRDINKIEVLDSTYGNNGPRIGELKIESRDFSGILDILSNERLDECKKIIDKINKE